MVQYQTFAGMIEIQRRPSSPTQENLGEPFENLAVQKTFVFLCSSVPLKHTKITAKLAELVQ